MFLHLIETVVCAMYSIYLYLHDKWLPVGGTVGAVHNTFTSQQEGAGALQVQSVCCP